MKLESLNEEEKQKMSQDKAGYMVPVDESKHDKPSGLFSCGNCENFLPPNGCKGVAGHIVKGGCCNNYHNPKLAK